MFIEYYKISMKKTKLFRIKIMKKHINNISIKIIESIKILLHNKKYSTYILSPSQESILCDCVCI